MQGQRIKLAIDALKLFLHSIPFGSKFNVISFGSEFESLFPKSMIVDEQIFEIALY